MGKFKKNKNNLKIIMNMAFKKEFYIKELEKKGAILPCHRCGSTNFTLIDQYSNLIIQNNLEGMVLGGTTIPVILVACSKCGAITQHAVGAFEKLDDLNNKQE